MSMFIQSLSPKHGVCAAKPCRAAPSPQKRAPLPGAHFIFALAIGRSGHAPRSAVAAVHGVEEAHQLAAAHRVLELFQRLGLDLADALAGDVELAPHFLQRVRVVVADAVAELDDFALAESQRLEDVVDFVLQHVVAGDVDGAVHRGVLDEVAEMGVLRLALAHGAVEGNRMLADAQHPPRLAHRNVGFLRDFVHRRLAADFLHQKAGDAPQAAHRFDHVHRNADGARLVGDGAGDGLTNPPRRVGGELVPAAVFVFLHRLHQAGVAFLNQVDEAESPVAVLLGDRHHQPEVAVGKLLLDHLILAVAGGHVGGAGAQAVQRLLGDHPDFEQAVLRLFQPPLVLRRQVAHPAGEQFLDFLLEGDGVFRHLLQPMLEGHDALGAQAQFLD